MRDKWDDMTDMMRRNTKRENEKETSEEEEKRRKKEKRKKQKLRFEERKNEEIERMEEVKKEEKENETLRMKERETREQSDLQGRYSKFAKDAEGQILPLQEGKIKGNCQINDVFTSTQYADTSTVDTVSIVEENGLQKASGDELQRQSGKYFSFISLVPF